MHYKPVKATVGAIVENQGKILLALRNHEPFYNHGCIPGGHIDFSETVEDAMLREIKEETGLDIEEYKYFKELDWHAVALIFIAKARGELKKQDKEVKELKWYTLEEGLNLPLAFDHKNILMEFQRDVL